VIDCQAVNETADLIYNKFKPGDAISVSGRLNANYFKSADGKTKKSIYVSVYKVELKRCRFRWSY